MEKNSRVKVSKIDIEIGDVEVSITPEQAKQLLGALQELVGEKKIIERVIERGRFLHWWEYPYWGSGDTVTVKRDNTTAWMPAGDTTVKITV